MDDSKLNQNEYSLVEQTLNEKIQEWTSEIDKLSKQIQDAESTLTKIRGFSTTPQKRGNIEADTKLETIVIIFHNAKKNWLQSGYIREQYRKSTGSEIPKSTLRHYLKAEHENISFERRGERRHTEWKLIETTE